MERYNKVIGNFGEDEACKFLIKNGYKIIERNYNCRFGEIDIIAKDGDCLVFVEVKTRTSSKYGAPGNAVNFYKVKHLTLSARMYIDKNRLANYFSRFDIVEIFAKYADNNFMVDKINIIKNAF